MSQGVLARSDSAALAAPSGRASKKAATRNRVIDAARALFDTKGYDGASIREIASQAGVSVGSVFTTFSSKGEILSEVMQERLTLLYAELDRVIPHLRASTADRLRSMFAIQFAFEASHTKLFLAHISAAYDWTLSSEARPFGRTPRLRQIIRECLERGVEEGDVAAGVDLDEVVDLLLAAYAWVYRMAAWDGADVASMTSVMDRQIGLIAASFRRP